MLVNNHLPSFAGQTASSAKAKKSESRNSSAKKPKALAAPGIPVRVFQIQTLEEIVACLFAQLETTDLEMEYVKETVFSWQRIMA